MDMQEKAITMLEAQQAKVKPHSPQWMVGEQLKDICRMEPKSAELIAQEYHRGREEDQGLFGQPQRKGGHLLLCDVGGG